MHELITKYFYGEITAKEKKQLFSAMETDAELKKEFLSVQNLCALTSWIPAEKDESVASVNFSNLSKLAKKNHSQSPISIF